MSAKLYNYTNYKEYTIDLEITDTPDDVILCYTNLRTIETVLKVKLKLKDFEEYREYRLSNYPYLLDVEYNNPLFNVIFNVITPYGTFPVEVIETIYDSSNTLKASFYSMLSNNIIYVDKVYNRIEEIKDLWSVYEFQKILATV